jgi:nitrogen fixation-related uncharacterized protein
MIRNVLSHIGGVESYGLISICLFFTFFCGVLLWSLRLRQNHLDGMSHLPLEDDERPEAKRNHESTYERS